MTDALLLSLHPDAPAERLREIMVHICQINNEYRRRIQQSSARANRYPAKRYYQKLYEKFIAIADDIFDELRLLNSENAKP